MREISVKDDFDVPLVQAFKHWEGLIEAELP
jgi:hypothetical protein